MPCLARIVIRDLAHHVTWRGLRRRDLSGPARAAARKGTDHDTSTGRNGGSVPQGSPTRFRLGGSDMRLPLALFILLLATLPVRAEIAVGFTAEWLSHESALIALATPVEVENIKGPGDVWVAKTRFRLEEVIKGPETKGDTVTIYDFSMQLADLQFWGKAKEESKQFLVFATVARNMFRDIEGRYLFTRVRPFRSAYYADQPVAKLYTADFRALTKFDELLKRTRDQVAHETNWLRISWKNTIEKKALEVPIDSEAFRQLYAGSVCYVWVPEYKTRATQPDKPPAGDGE